MRDLNNSVTKIFALSFTVPRIQGGPTCPWPSRHRLRRVRERDPIRRRQRRSPRLQDHSQLGDEDLVRQEINFKRPLKPSLRVYSSFGPKRVQINFPGFVCFYANNSNATNA